MCITTNNPSEPCCEGASRCVACPRVDWNQYTFWIEYDSYDSGDIVTPEVRPEFSGKMTQGSGCVWVILLESGSVEPPAYDHRFADISLERSRDYYDLDGQWWRLLFGVVSDIATGPYNIDPLNCNTENVLTRSQARFDELTAQGADMLTFEDYPESIRIMRVVGQGPVLPV